MKSSRQSKKSPAPRTRPSRPPEHTEEPSAEEARESSRTASDRRAVIRGGDDALGPTKAFPT